MPKLGRVAGSIPESAHFLIRLLVAGMSTPLRWMVTSTRSRQIVLEPARPPGRCRSAHWEPTRRRPFPTGESTLVDTTVAYMLSTQTLALNFGRDRSTGRGLIR